MSLLYVSVSLSSLFLTIWFVAYFSLFQLPAVAEPADIVASAEAAKAEEAKEEAKAMAAIRAKQAVAAVRTTEGIEEKQQDPAVATDVAKVRAKEAMREVKAEAVATEVKDVQNQNEAGGNNSSTSNPVEQASDIPVENDSSAIQTQSLDNVASKDQTSKNPNEPVVPSAQEEPVTNPTSPASSVAQESPNVPEDSPSIPPVHREISSTESDSDNIPAPPGQETQLKQQQVSEKKQKKSSLLDSARQLQQRITQLITVAKNPYNVDIKGRNPFKSFKKSANSKKEKVIALTPPEKYALEKMKLVGIKWGVGLTPPTALFRAPDGKVFHLQKNDRIGETRGIVYLLREDEVVIVQPKSGNTPDQDKLYTPIIVSLSRHRTNSATKSVVR